MATVRYAAFLAVILVMAAETSGDNPESPPSLFPPLTGGVRSCDETQCGRGVCIESTRNPLGFECACEPGWRQAGPADDLFLTFLPCVIPDCTIDFNCGNAGVPKEGDETPSNDNGYNTTLFDPCSVGDCGGGRCSITSQFTRACICADGYLNLFNSTLYPCYRQCAYGAGCPFLGLNITTSVIDPLYPGTFNKDPPVVSLARRAEFARFITITTTLALLLWKYI